MMKFIQCFNDKHEMLSTFLYVFLICVGSLFILKFSGCSCVGEYHDPSLYPYVENLDAYLR